MKIGPVDPEIICLKLKQEAFEKCWAHSPQRAAARRIAIHQVSLLSRRTPPAHRCPRRRRRRRRRQQQRVTEGTAMAPWNGPKKKKLMQAKHIAQSAT